MIAQSSLTILMSISQNRNAVVECTQSSNRDLQRRMIAKENLSGMIKGFLLHF